jgi:hypothetical protein
VIKNYCIEVPLKGITSVPNFMKIYQAFQKLLVGDTQTDRQTGDLISLLSFLEIRLKIVQDRGSQTFIAYARL